MTCPQDLRDDWGGAEFTQLCFTGERSEVLW